MDNCSCFEYIKAECVMGSIWGLQENVPGICDMSPRKWLCTEAMCLCTGALYNIIFTPHDNTTSCIITLFL